MTNMFSPLSDINFSMNSISSAAPSSPLFTSSPRHTSNSSKSSVNLSRSRRTRSNNSDKSTFLNSSTLHKNGNLRLLTVNCCSVRENKAEFKASLEYVKPDIICGTESWLRGVKPGKDPAKNAILSSEFFPDNFTFHRNDRGTRLGGGVFTALVMA